jgi:flagellar hook-basal body complex protein FliE
MRGYFNAMNSNGFAGFLLPPPELGGGIFYKLKNWGSFMDVSIIGSALSQLKTGATLASGKTMQGGSDGDGGGTNSVGFSTVLKNSLDNVNNAQQRAIKLTKAFELGEPDANLTEAMIAMQKASLSFQYSLQVRNKLVAAYQDIMSMPV